MQVSHSSSRSIPQHFVPVDIAESLYMMLNPVQSLFAGEIHGSWRKKTVWLLQSLCCYLKIQSLAAMCLNHSGSHWYMLVRRSQHSDLLIQSDHLFWDEMQLISWPVFSCVCRMIFTLLRQIRVLSQRQWKLTCCAIDILNKSASSRFLQSLYHYHQKYKRCNDILLIDSSWHWVSYSFYPLL